MDGKRLKRSVISLMQKKELTDKSTLTKFELAFLIVAATVTITVVSTCSPLYPFNPWDDANCFFTLGRGIIHGMVPYRDLYEQKGPVLYFIYAFAALINDKSFIGAWIVECITASVFAVYSWKIAKLFSEPSRFCLVVTPLFLGLTYSTGLFNFGGNAEELCFPFLTVILYIGLRAIVNSDALPTNKDAVICGLITAALFWVKYTFMGFIAGFCLYILVMSIRRKAFARLWSLIWRFIAGFIILSIPVLIYFIANNALNSLWEAYFYNNIFLYQNTKASGILAIPVVKNIYIPLYCLFALSWSHKLFGFMMLASVISMFFTGKKHLKKVLFLFAITFVISVGVVFSKNTFIYYYLYIHAYFLSFVLIPLIKGINLLTVKFKQNSSFIKVITAAFVIVCYAVTLLLNKNLYLLAQPKEYLAQYRYAQVINSTPNAKILTYDIMDAGFFTAAGVLPSNRFYCYLNIEQTYPAILEEQNRLISEGYYDYIITYTDREYNWNNYKLILEESDDYVDYNSKKVKFSYRLYKKI